MFSEQGEPVASINAYNVALQIDPNNAQILTPLAIELAKTNRRTDALVQLRKALSLDPNHLEANYYLCKMLLQNDEESKLSGNSSNTLPIDSLRRCLLQLPVSNIDEVHPLVGPAYKVVITSLERSNNISEAVDSAYEWTLRSPTDAHAHFEVSKLFSEILLVF